jgi:hypothetical protein
MWNIKYHELAPTAAPQTMMHEWSPSVSAGPPRRSAFQTDAQYRAHVQQNGQAIQRANASAAMAHDGNPVVPSPVPVSVRSATRAPIRLDGLHDDGETKNLGTGVPRSATHERYLAETRFAARQVAPRIPAGQPRPPSRPG